MYVPAFAVASQRDATGAGDAYLGGLVARLAHVGLPGEHGGGNAQSRQSSLEQELRELGHIGSVAGAACCQVLGALPPDADHGGGSELFDILRGASGEVPLRGADVMESTAAQMRADASG